ncbi:uncharacterized protein LOC105164929 isoform X2 [Sesamum indicum]|uniref:Uncharacterized protein LOC105164929 isoform X2 n=1 Tax=Sesamum indicum TaxID=4182 RepID=A0A6I9TM32_SESIN|nr:uncharacterized protein LOC105164929 isoform X2 [Sesamum indicum]
MEPLSSCSATAVNSGILRFMGQKMEIKIICEPDGRWIVGGHGKNGDTVTCSKQEVEIDSVTQLEHKQETMFRCIDLRWIPCPRLQLEKTSGGPAVKWPGDAKDLGKKGKTSNVTLPSCCSPKAKGEHCQRHVANDVVIVLQLKGRRRTLPTSHGD